MRSFSYLAPQTVPEALGLLAEHGPTARILAGGTDLLLLMQDGKIQPDVLVDLAPIRDLRRIGDDDEGGLRMGPLVSLRQIEQDQRVAARYPALAQSTFELAGVQIRNMATIGGNTCNASPAADTIPALMALDAVAVISGPGLQRRVPYRELFIGPGKTVLKAGELLTAIELPPPAPRSGSCYIKLAVRRAMDIAIVGLAAAVELADGVVERCRIVLGAVGPTVMRAPEAEKLLEGSRLDPDVLDRVAEAAQAVARPISDQRASADYRLLMVAVLTRQALRQAAAEAGG